MRIVAGPLAGAASRTCSCSTSRSARWTRSPAERLNDELLALFADRGFAALFITHSVAEAVFLSTRVAVMSARPGQILGEVSIPFGYPRQPDMRYSEEFAKVAGEVSDLLRDVPQRPAR